MEIFDVIFVGLVAVEPRDGYRIWVRYEDGIEGELDLSYCAGKGVFKAWDERAFFESVHISEKGGFISWGRPPGSDMELDIAPEIGYALLLGITLEQISAMSDDNEFFAAVERARQASEVSVNA